MHVFAMAKAICANSFYVHRAGLRTRILIASLKAKIFGSIFCNKGLKHETKAIMCWFVISCFATDDHDQDNYHWFSIADFRRQQLITMPIETRNSAIISAKCPKSERTVGANRRSPALSDRCHSALVAI